VGGRAARPPTEALRDYSVLDRDPGSDVEKNLGKYRKKKLDGVFSGAKEREEKTQGKEASS